MSEPEYLYLVHYPFYEDGCIQYADALFRSETLARAFALAKNASVPRRVMVFG